MNKTYKENTYKTITGLGVHQMKFYSPCGQLTCQRKYRLIKLKLIILPGDEGGGGLVGGAVGLASENKNTFLLNSVSSTLKDRGEGFPLPGVQDFFE